MLILIRGVSGSGKSTLVNSLEGKIGEFVHLEADMFFYEEGVYKFNFKKLKDAHAWCLSETQKALSEGKTVIVSNTFTRIWEMEPYLALNPSLVVKMETQYKNVHGVPEEAVQSMIERFETHEGEFKFDSNMEELLKILK